MDNVLPGRLLQNIPWNHHCFGDLFLLYLVDTILFINTEYSILNSKLKFTGSQCTQCTNTCFGTKIASKTIVHRELVLFTA